MRRNTIKITVTGGAKTGKSTVIAHIARMLQDSGFSVNLQAGSVDGKTTRAVLRDKARLAHVTALSDVRIEEQVVEREKPVSDEHQPNAAQADR